MRWRLLPGLLAFSSFASAWHDTGHMVVAEIAVRRLNPEVRLEAERLIKIGGTPTTGDLVSAACWADDTRTRENGLWHYINYHFRTDGKPVVQIPLAENVVWAIRKFSEVLKDPSKADPVRADALRFLLHFVGDIHQPLHNVAHDTDALPEGDRGGNEFKLLAPDGMQPAPRNLHFLWDMGAGAFPHVERPLDPIRKAQVDRLADALAASFPASAFESHLAKFDPEDWSREAVPFAHGKLYKLAENQVPSAEYLAMCRKESQRLVVLAGYRLGSLMNRVLARPR